MLSDTNDVDTVISQHWTTFYREGDVSMREGDVSMQKLIEQLDSIVCVKAIAQIGIGSTGQGPGVYLYIPMHEHRAIRFIERIQSQEDKIDKD